MDYKGEIFLYSAFMIVSIGTLYLLIQDRNALAQPNRSLGPSPDIKAGSNESFSTVEKSLGADQSVISLLIATSSFLLVLKKDATPARKPVYRNLVYLIALPASVLCVYGLVISLLYAFFVSYLPAFLILLIPCVVLLYLNSYGEKGLGGTT